MAYDAVGAAISEIRTFRKSCSEIRVVLAIIFGPLGLFYSSILGGMVMTTLAIGLGLLTYGLALMFVWPACIGWAMVTARRSLDSE